MELTDQEKAALRLILERQAQVQGVESMRLVLSAYDKLCCDGGSDEAEMVPFPELKSP